MTGKTSSPSIEALLDRLFRAVARGDGAPGIDPRMALKPDASAGSYYVPAPRPSLTLDDMLRPGREAPLAETERLLEDAGAAQRAEIVGLLRELHEALAAARQDGAAEPPSLIYALH